MSHITALDILPLRVVFGCGSLAELPAELERMDAERVAVVTSPGRRAQGDALCAQLGSRSAGVIAEALPHVPDEAVERGVERARELDAGALVAIGGGSSIGLGKVIAARTGALLVNVPTTYSGSEMTDVYGITAGGRKRTTRDGKAGAALIVYDPELTLSLPTAASVASAFNAAAQAAAQLYAPGGDPAFVAVALEALRRLFEGMPAVAADGSDLGARTELMRGAYLAGLALRQGIAGGGGLTLHHKLCHLLGGAAGLPHAETHTVMLPQVLDFLRGSIPAAMRQVAEILGTEDAAVGIFDLAERVGAPTSLTALGLEEAQVDGLLEPGMEYAEMGPRRFDRAGLRALLVSALEGRRPTSPLSPTSG